jgi:hypothetical protein
VPFDRQVCAEMSLAGASVVCGTLDVSNGHQAIQAIMVEDVAALAWPTQPLACIQRMCTAF